MLRGSYLGRLRRYREAEADLRAILRSHPSHGPAHFELGQLAWRRSVAAEAAAHFTRALDCQPLDGRIYYYLAEALNLMGDLAGANGVLDRALEATPRDGKVYHLRGRVLDRLGTAGRGSRHVSAEPRAARLVITVVVGDLPSLQVDALLRPAGESLEPLAAVASRLDAVGGQRFADQHRITSPLEAGAAVVTGGGDLVAPFVIHVVIRDSLKPVGADHRPPGAGLGLAAGGRLGTDPGGGSPGRCRRWSPEHGRGSGAAGRDLSSPRRRGRTRRAPYRGGTAGGSGRGGSHRTEDGVIRLTDLTKRYGKFTAVDGITLHVPRGELFGLLGPERRRQDHHHADDRGDPAAHQRLGLRGRHGHAGQSAGRQGAHRLHPRPALRLRQAHRLRVPALRRRALRPGRSRHRAADGRAAGGLRPRRPGRTSSPRPTATGCGRS